MEQKNKTKSGLLTIRPLMSKSLLVNDLNDDHNKFIYSHTNWISFALMHTTLDNVEKEDNEGNNEFDKQQRGDLEVVLH